MALDAHAATADADDLAGTSGEATIPAGETQAEIAMEIADDMDIEPARERCRTRKSRHLGYGS